MRKQLVLGGLRKGRMLSLDTDLAHLWMAVSSRASSPASNSIEENLSTIENLSLNCKGGSPEHINLKGSSSHVTPTATWNSAMRAMTRHVQTRLIYMPVRRINNMKQQKPESKQPMTCPGTCWHCGKTPEDYFLCGKCGTIQPPKEEIDAFELFNYQEPCFDLDAEDLEKRYKNLQRSLHPDKFSRSSQKEQVLSAEQATAVNHAYGTLKDPLSRANYILSRYGMESSEGKMISDLEMLEKVMEFREEVEESNDIDALNALKKRADEQVEDCLRELRTNFQQKDLTQASENAVVLRYLTRIQEAIIHKL